MREFFLPGQLRRAHFRLPALAAVVCIFWLPALATAQNVVSQRESSPSVNLPLNHFAYTFIEKLESKGVLAPAIELRNRPFTRTTVTKVILELDQKLREHPERWTNSERALFLKLKGEFHEELKPDSVEIPADEIEKHILQWHSGGGGETSYAIGDAILDQSLGLSRFNAKEDSLNENVSHTAVSGRVRGILKGAIAFYSDFTSTLIKGSKGNYTFGQNTQGGVINTNPNSKNVYSLQANAYLAIEPRYFRLQYGKEPLILGPAKHSNLFLSDHAPAFDNLRLDVTFRRLKFTYVHGWLRSDPLPFDNSGALSDKKYIAIHRLEFMVFPWLFVAGNESVVYGGRGLQPAYLNPIMIYHIAEQYLGDKDNHQLSFDATAFPLRNVKTYASLFIDDLTLSKNPFTYWKQTWAALWGIYWVEPMHVPDADFRFEYSRVEPYVYAHKWGLINFSHFGSGLGSFLQPNSDDAFFEVRYWPLRRFNFGLSYERIRHGQGDIGTFGYADGYVDAPPGKTKKAFLVGTKEIQQLVSLTAQWETFHNHYLSISYGYLHASNYQNIPDRSLTQNRLAVGYRLDY